MSNEQIILYHKVPVKEIFIEDKKIEILDTEIKPEGTMKLTNKNLTEIKKYVSRLNRNLFLEGKLKEKYFFKIERVN